jgi:hypothetical protein
VGIINNYERTGKSITILEVGKMKRIFWAWKVAIFLLVSSLCAVNAVQAIPITIEITGNITSASGIGLPDGIAIGDIFTGIYTYDSSTLDSNTHPDRGYYQNGSPYGMFIFLEEYEFKTSPNDGFRIQIWNNHTIPGGRSYDLYRVESFGVVPFPAIEYYQFYWNLEDGTQNALSSDDLPIKAPILSEWKSNLFQISSGNSFLINGTVTYAVLVPEPATLLLLGLGGLLIRKRR